MIKLTRLNNQPLMVNSDLIKFIENTPDTVITLITGEKVVVLETAKEVLEEIIKFRRRLLVHDETSLPEGSSESSGSASEEVE